MLNARLERDHAEAGRAVPRRRRVEGRLHRTRRPTRSSSRAGVKDGGIERGARGAADRGAPRRPVRLPRSRSSTAHEAEHGARLRARVRRAREDAVGRRSSASTSTTTSIGEAIPGIEYEYKLVQQLVPTITLADVNTLARRAGSPTKNRVIIAQAPHKDGVDDADARRSCSPCSTRRRRCRSTAYTENLSAEALLANEPTPGTGRRRAVQCRQSASPSGGCRTACACS